MASLPKPKESDWELELPEEQQEAVGDTELSEEDATERDRRNNAIREVAERAEFKRRTQVMQKSLPRPAIIDIEVLIKEAAAIDDPIEKEIAQEMALLMANDALKYHVLDTKVHGSSQPLEHFDDELLQKARLELPSEVPPSESESFQAEFAAAWEDVHGHSKLPGLAGYEDDEIDEHQLMIEAFDVRFPCCFRTSFYYIRSPLTPLNRDSKKAPSPPQPKVTLLRKSSHCTLAVTKHAPRLYDKISSRQLRRWNRPGSVLILLGRWRYVSRQLLQDDWRD